MKRTIQYRRAYVLLGAALIWLFAGLFVQAAVPGMLAKPGVYQLLEQHAIQGVCVVPSDRANTSLENPFLCLSIPFHHPSAERKSNRWHSGRTIVIHDTVLLHRRLLYTMATSSSL